MIYIAAKAAAPATPPATPKVQPIQRTAIRATTETRTTAVGATEPVRGTATTTGEAKATATEATTTGKEPRVVATKETTWQAPASAAGNHHRAYKRSKDAEAENHLQAEERRPGSLLLSGHLQKDPLTEGQDAWPHEEGHLSERIQQHETDQQQDDHQHEVLQQKYRKRAHQVDLEQQHQSRQHHHPQVAHRKERDIVAPQQKQNYLLQRDHRADEVLNLQPEETASLQAPQQSDVWANFQLPPVSMSLHQDDPAVPGRVHPQPEAHRGHLQPRQYQTSLFTQQHCPPRVSSVELQEKQQQLEHVLLMPEGGGQLPSGVSGVQHVRPRNQVEQDQRQRCHHEQQQQVKPEEEWVQSHPCSKTAPHLQEQYSLGVYAAEDCTSWQLHKQQEQQTLVAELQQNAQIQEPAKHLWQPAHKEQWKLQRQKRKARQYQQQEQEKQSQGHGDRLQQDRHQSGQFQGQEKDQRPQERTQELHEPHNQQQKVIQRQLQDELAEQQPSCTDQRHGKHQHQVFATGRHGLCSSRGGNTEEMLLKQVRRQQRLLDTFTESLRCLHLFGHKWNAAAARRGTATSVADKPLCGAAGSPSGAEEGGQRNAAATRDCTRDTSVPKTAVAAHSERAAPESTVEGAAWAGGAPPGHRLAKQTAGAVQCISPARNVPNIPPSSEGSTSNSYIGNRGASSTAWSLRNSCSSFANKRWTGDEQRSKCKWSSSTADDEERQRDEQQKCDHLSFLFQLQNDRQEWSRLLVQQHEVSPIEQLAAATFTAAIIAGAVLEEQLARANHALPSTQMQQPADGDAAQRLGEDLFSSLAVLDAALAGAVPLNILALPSFVTSSAALPQCDASVCAATAPTGRPAVVTHQPVFAAPGYFPPAAAIVPGAAFAYERLAAVLAALDAAADGALTSSAADAESVSSAFPNRTSLGCLRIPRIPAFTAEISASPAVGIPSLSCRRPPVFTPLAANSPCGAGKMPLPAAPLFPYQCRRIGAQDDQPVAERTTAAARSVQVTATAEGMTAVRQRGATAVRTPEGLAEAESPSAEQTLRKNAPGSLRAAATERTGLGAASPPHEFELHAVLHRQSKAAEAPQTEPSDTLIEAAAVADDTLEPPAGSPFMQTDESLSLREGLQQDVIGSVSVQRKPGTGARLVAANGFRKRDGWQQQTQEGRHSQQPQQQRGDGENKVKRDQTQMVDTQARRMKTYQRQCESARAPNLGAEQKNAKAIGGASESVPAVIAPANDAATAVANSETDKSPCTSLSAALNVEKHPQLSGITTRDTDTAAAISAGCHITAATRHSSTLNASFNGSFLRAPAAPADTSTAAPVAVAHTSRSATAACTDYDAAACAALATTATSAAASIEKKPDAALTWRTLACGQRRCTTTLKKVKEENQEDNGNAAVSCANEDAFNKGGKLWLSCEDCWMCITSSSGDSTSPSPVSSSAWSPLSVSSSSPTSPIYQQTQLLPLVPFLSAVEPRPLAPIRRRQGGTDRRDAEEDIQQQPRCLPRLRQKSHSAPHLLLQQRGLRLLVRSRVLQQQIRCLFIPSQQRRPNTVRPLEQAQRPRSRLHLEQQQPYFRLLRSDAQLNQTRINFLHLLQQQQQRHLSLSHAPRQEQGGGPVQRQQHQQERDHLQQPSRKNVTEMYQQTVQCVDAYATEQQQPVLLTAIRQLLLSLRRLLLLFHILYVAGALTTRLHRQASSEPHKHNNTSNSDTSSSNSSSNDTNSSDASSSDTSSSAVSSSDGSSSDTSSRSSSMSCLGINTGSNGHSNRSTCCCLTDHSSGRWTNDSERSEALQGALWRSHVLLLELLLLAASRQVQHSEISPVAAAALEAARSRADCYNAANVAQTLLVPTTSEAGRDQTSVEDCARKSLNLPHERRAARTSRNKIRVETALPSRAVKVTFNSTLLSQAANKPLPTVNSKTVHEDDAADCSFATAAERRQADKERPVEDADSTSLVHVTTESSAAGIAGSPVGAAEHLLEATVYDLAPNLAEGADETLRRPHPRIRALEKTTTPAQGPAFRKSSRSTEEHPATASVSWPARGSASPAIVPIRDVAALGGVAVTLQDTMKSCNAPEGGARNGNVADAPGFSPALEPTAATAASIPTRAADRETLFCLRDMTIAALSVACEVWTWLNPPDRSAAPYLTVQDSNFETPGTDKTALAALVAAGLRAAAVTPGRAVRCTDIAAGCCGRSSVPPPAGFVAAVEATSTEGAATSDRPLRRGPTSSDVTVDAAGASLDKSSGAVTAHAEGKVAESAFVGPVEIVESAARANTAQADRLSTALPRHRLQKACVCRNNYAVDDAAVAAAGNSAPAGQVAGQQRKKRIDCRHNYCSCSSCMKRSEGCLSTWRSRGDRPSSNADNCCNCRGRKQRLRARNNWTYIWNCTSSSENEDESLFCATTTSLEEISEAEKGLERLIQQVTATDTPTTTGTSARSDETDEAGFRANATPGAAKEDPQFLANSPATAAVTATTMVRAESSNTRIRQDAAGKGEQEEQALMRRRQRQMLQRSLLLLRGCWMMRLLTDVRSSSKPSGSKNRRRRTSSSSIIYGGLGRLCSRRQPDEDIHGKIETAEATAIETDSPEAPLEGVQLLRRYLFVSPDFQYICCTDIPPPSAASVAFEEIASPLPPPCQQRLQCPQTQQRQFPAEQPEQQTLVDCHKEPQQSSQEKRRQCKQQEPERLLPRECRLQKAHTGKTSQQAQQQQQGQHIRLEAQPAHESHEGSEQFQLAQQEYGKTFKRKQLQRKRPLWEERKQQHLLQSTQTYSCGEEGEGNQQQPAVAEEGTKEQQHSCGEHREKNQEARGSTGFIATLQIKDRRETLLSSSSPVATDERQQRDSGNQTNRTAEAAAVEVQDLEESESAEQHSACLAKSGKPEHPSNWRDLCSAEKMPCSATRGSNSSCESAADERRLESNLSSESRQHCKEDNSGSSIHSSSEDNSNESSTGGYHMDKCSATPQERFVGEAVKRVKADPRSIQQSCSLKKLERVGYAATCSQASSDDKDVSGSNKYVSNTRGNERHNWSSFKPGSVVLGYGSLDGIPNVSTCSPQCPEGYTLLRKSVLQPPKPVLPPASCAWCCAEDVPFGFNLNATSNGSIGKLNCNSKPSCSSICLDQQMQQRQTFQTKTLRRQQRSLQEVYQQPAEKRAEPFSSSRQKQQEQKHQGERNAPHGDNKALLRQPSKNAGICSASSSSSNSQRPNKRRWNEQRDVPELLHAAKLPSLNLENANTNLNESLAVDAKSIHAPSASAAAASSLCSWKEENSKDTFTEASAAIGCATKFPPIAEPIAADIEARLEAAGERQAAAAKQAAPAAPLVTGTATARQSTRTHFRQPRSNMQPSDDTGTHSSSGNSNSPADFGFCSSRNKLLSRGGRLSQPKKFKENEKFLNAAEPSMLVYEQGATQRTPHTLPEATARSAHAASAGICPQQAPVSSSPVCAAATASRSAYGAATPSAGPSCAVICHDAAAAATSNPVCAASSEEPGESMVHQREARRIREERGFSTLRRSPIHISAQGGRKQQQQRGCCGSAHREATRGALQQDQQLATVCIPLERVSSLEYGYRSSTYQRLQRSGCSLLQSIPPYLCCSIRVTLPEHVTDETSATSALRQPELLQQQKQEAKTQERTTQQTTQIDMDFVTLTATDARRWVIGLNGLIPYSPGRVLYTEEEVGKQLRVMQRQEKQRRYLERSLRHWQKAVAATASTQISRTPLRSPLRSCTSMCGLLRSCSSNRHPPEKGMCRRARHAKCRKRGAAFRDSSSSCCTSVSSRTKNSRKSDNRILGLDSINCPSTFCTKSRAHRYSFHRTSSSRTLSNVRTQRNSTTSQESSSCCPRRDRSGAAINNKRPSGGWNASKRAPKDNRGGGGRRRCVRQDAPHNLGPTSRLSNSSSADIDSSGRNRCRGTSSSTVSTEVEQCRRAGQLQNKPHSGRRAMYRGWFRSSSVYGNEVRVDTSSNRKEQQQQQLHILPLRCHKLSSTVAFHSGTPKTWDTGNLCSHCCCCYCNSPPHLSLPERAAAEETEANQSSCSSTDGCIRGFAGGRSFPRATRGRSYSAPPSLSGGSREEEKHHYSVTTPRQASAVAGRFPAAAFSSAALSVCAVPGNCSAVDCVTASGAGYPCVAAYCSMCSAVEAATALSNEKKSYVDTKRRRPFFQKLFRFATLRWNAKQRRQRTSRPSNNMRKSSSCSASLSSKSRNGDSGTGSNNSGSTPDRNGATRTSNRTSFGKSINACVHECGQPRAANPQHCCRCSVSAASALRQSSCYNSPRLDNWSPWSGPWDASPAASQQKEGDGPESSALPGAIWGEGGQAPRQEPLPLAGQPRQEDEQGQKRLDGISPLQQVEYRAEHQQTSPSQQQHQITWPTRQRLLLDALQNRRHEQLKPAQQQQQLQGAVEKYRQYKTIPSFGLLDRLHSFRTSSTRCSSTSSLSSSGLQLLRDAKSLDCVPRAAEAGCSTCIRRDLFIDIRGQQQVPQQQWQQKAAHQEHEGNQQNQDVPEWQQEKQNRQQQLQFQSWAGFSSCRDPVGLPQSQQAYCCTNRCPRCNVQGCSGNFAGTTACSSAFFNRRCASCSSISYMSSPCSNTAYPPSTLSFNNSPLLRSSSTDYKTSLFQNSCAWKECTCSVERLPNNISHQCFSTEPVGSTSPNSSLGGSVRNNTPLERSAAASPLYITAPSACSSVPTAGPGAAGSDATLSTGTAATEEGKCMCMAPLDRADDSSGIGPKEPSEQLICHFPDQQPHPNWQQQQQQQQQQGLVGHSEDLPFHPQQLQHLRQPADSERKDKHQGQLNTNQEGYTESHKKLEGITPIAEEDYYFYMHQQEVYERGEDNMTSGEEAPELFEEGKEDQSESDEESILFSAY